MVRCHLRSYVEFQPNLQISNSKFLQEPPKEKLSKLNTENSI